MTLGATELMLINRWQRDFPLEPRPYARVGRSAGLDEETTIATFERLIDDGIMTRIGAVVRPHAVGASTLAAMCVPRPRLETVAAQVSAEPLVNHNYERDHALNLWFVVAGPDQDALTQTLARIQRTTGLGVLALPLVRAYHLDLGFSLDGATEREARQVQARAHADYSPCADDRRVLAAIEDGLPLTARPYREVGHALDCDEADVITRIRGLAAAKIVTRMGCIVRHRSLGFTANAMAVWDVPEIIIDDVAARMIRNPRVTLCYRRQRRPPDWPYNLFCMVHAKTRGDALAIIDDVNGVAGTSRFDHAVLFSTRCFKQRGAVFSGEGLSGGRLN
ncbi:MAG: Lrp/AsnC family transcriptional regulator [Xanthobacteraceae bacterium]